MSAPPTRCCVQTLKGTRCANEPSPVRPVRMIGPVRLAACGLEAHQRALWSLPGFVRHDAYCGAFGCDRPSNAGICPKHRDMYRDFGITEHMLLAPQEAPMTEPTPPSKLPELGFPRVQIHASSASLADLEAAATGMTIPTPPAEPKGSAGVGAPSVTAHLAAITEIERDLRTRRDAVAARLLSAGFEMEYGTLQTTAYRKGDLLVSLPMDDRGLSLSDFERMVVRAEVAAPTAIISALLKDAAEMATAEPHPLEARRDRLVATLLGAGFEEKPAISGRVRRFAYCNDYWVIVPNGPAAESQEDFARALDTAEAALKRLTFSVDTPHLPVVPAPADDGEPSVGDVADAPLFVGGTDAAPELVARWGQVHTAPVQPMSADLDGLAAPSPTVAELQAELKEMARLSECRRKEVQRRGDALARVEALLKDAEAQLNAITDALDDDPERSPAWDGDGNPIPLPRRVEIALMPDPVYERELRKSLHAVEAELFEVDRALQHLGAYGNGPTKERLLQVLTPEDRRAILEVDAAEARMDLARLRARRLNPAPPERVAEYEARVAALDARIAALDAG